MRITTYKKSYNFTPAKETELLLMQVKEKGTFRFVNLTKGHITQCEFNSVSEAFTDFIENYFLKGKFDAFSVSNDNGGKQ